MAAFLIFMLCGLLVLRLDGMERLNLRTSGSVSVVDGDTIRQGSERIRLKGIDAFEVGQMCNADGGAYDCGRRATQALRSLIGSAPVACEGMGRDRYGRLLATCYADGRDLNGALVSDGWALAYGAYEREEAQARAARRGAWAGDFDRPSAVRATRGDAGDVPHDLGERIMSLLRRLSAGGEQSERSGGMS